jgi:hypothetical protein
MKGNHQFRKFSGVRGRMNTFSCSSTLALLHTPLRKDEEEMKKVRRDRRNAGQIQMGRREQLVKIAQSDGSC